MPPRRPRSVRTSMIRSPRLRQHAGRGPRGLQASDAGRRPAGRPAGQDPSCVRCRPRAPGNGPGMAACSVRADACAIVVDHPPRTGPARGSAGSSSISPGASCRKARSTPRRALKAGPPPCRSDAASAAPIAEDTEHVDAARAAAGPAPRRSAGGAVCRSRSRTGEAGPATHSSAPIRQRRDCGPGQPSIGSVSGPVLHRAPRPTMPQRPAASSPPPGLQPVLAPRRGGLPTRGRAIPRSRITAGRRRWRSGPDRPSGRADPCASTMRGAGPPASPRAARRKASWLREEAPACPAETISPGQARGHESAAYPAGKGRPTARSDLCRAPEDGSASTGQLTRLSELSELPGSYRRLGAVAADDHPALRRIQPPARRDPAAGYQPGPLPSWRCGSVRMR